MFIGVLFLERGIILSSEYACMICRDTGINSGENQGEDVFCSCQRGVSMKNLRRRMASHRVMLEKLKRVSEVGNQTGDGENYD